ncbi:hypothetical protein [Sphingobium boeckii]|uniref:Uncharacterized protein n=1 Tax=Sphingobium boeckii TaxID=1082345 RepID=A0A7W9AFJ0_9SPHN|nr:hypothetical protein [Sphingobium boeckii]MBB5684511.1 hypothetical protein [Sphingobium boeckii]
MGSSIHTKAGTANAEQGEVMLDGPDGVAVSMTADAARKTGLSLSEAADAADKQDREKADKEG